MHDVIVANGVWHGGGMMLAPDARPDDGLFDVVLIGDVGKVDFLTTAPKIYKGRHVPHPKVEVLRSQRVEVDAGRARCRSRSRASRSGTTPARLRGRAGRAARARPALAVGPLRSLARLALVLRAFGGCFFAAYSSFPTRCSSSPTRFSIASSPRTRFDRSSTRSRSCARPLQEPGRGRVLRCLAEHVFAERGEPVDRASWT